MIMVGLVSVVCTVYLSTAIALTCVIYWPVVIEVTCASCHNVSYLS